MNALCIQGQVMVIYVGVIYVGVIYDGVSYHEVVNDRRGDTARTRTVGHLLLNLVL